MVSEELKKKTEDALRMCEMFLNALGSKTPDPATKLDASAVQGASALCEALQEKLTPAPEFVHLELAPEAPIATDDLAALEMWVKHKTEETVAAGKAMCDAIQKWFDANPTRKKAPDLSVFGVLTAAMHVRAWREGYADFANVEHAIHYTINFDAVARQAWEILYSRVLANLKTFDKPADARTATIQEVKPAPAPDYDAWTKQFAAYSALPESRQIEYPIDLTVSLAEIIPDGSAPTAGIEPTTGSVIVACANTPDRYSLVRDWLNNNFEKEAKALQAEQQKTHDDPTPKEKEPDGLVTRQTDPVTGFFAWEEVAHPLESGVLDPTKLPALPERTEEEQEKINAWATNEKLIALSKCLGGLNPHVEMDLPLPTDDDVDTPVIVKK